MIWADPTNHAKDLKAAMSKIVKKFDDVDAIVSSPTFTLLSPEKSAILITMWKGHTWVHLDKPQRTDQLMTKIWY